MIKAYTVVIPLNRVKVSTEEAEEEDTDADLGRNPLKSGQGFNHSWSYWHGLSGAES